MADTKMIKLTGLWKSRNGESISGSLSPSTRLVILPNRYKKENSNEPDYIAFVAPNEPKPNHPPAPPPEDNVPF